MSTLADEAPGGAALRVRAWPDATALAAALGAVAAASTTGLGALALAFAVALGAKAVALALAAALAAGEAGAGLPAATAGSRLALHKPTVRPAAMARTVVRRDSGIA